MGPPDENTASGMDQGASRVKIPKRTIIVEPLLMSTALLGFPMMLVSQQYIYKEIQDEMASEKGMFNLSGGNQSGSDHPCLVNKSSEIYQFQEEVQARATYFGVMLSVASGIPALFTSLFLGGYSDKVGRKYAIIAPIIGGLIRSLSYIPVMVFGFPLWCLIIGAFLDGCTGYFQTLLLGCFAYIADITPPDKRQFRIAVVEFTMFISIIFGPIGLGYIIKELGFLIPILISTGGGFINLLYAIFLIPETIIKDPNAKFFDFSNIKSVITLYTLDNGTKRRWKLLVIAAGFFFYALVTFGDSNISTLFEMNSPLCWDAVYIGYYSAAYIAVAAIGGLILAKVLKICMTDKTIVVIAMVGAVALNTYKGFVRTTWMLFIVPVFGPAALLAIPTIRTIMSTLVSPSEQGAVFGGIAFVEIVCGIVGSSIFSSVYASTLEIWSGIVFFTMAISQFIGGAFIVFYIVASKKEKHSFTLLVNEVDTDDDDKDDRTENA